MKVRFKFGIKTFSGTSDEMTYGSYAKNTLCLGRQYVTPEYTANNQHVGAIGKNLASVFKNASAEYIADLKSYATRNGKENFHYGKLALGAYVLFVKLMYAWYKTDPTHIDLTAVTIADIVTKDADVRTIKRAIDAGYIRSIKSYADLTSDIQ